MERLLKLCFALAALILLPSAAAQWEVDGANARLIVDGRSAALVSPGSHDIDVVAPGPLVFEMASGQQAARIIFAISNVEPSGAAIASVPGLGIVNLGAPSTPVPSGITIVGDGIAMTVNPLLDPLYATSPGFGFDHRLPLSFSLSAASLGLRVACQSVVTDPTLPPFSLDLTQCADVTIVAGTSQTVLTGANGRILVPFAPGRSFPFHGASYTGVWVHEDGFVTFGAPATNTVGPGVDTRAFVSGPPGIAAWLGDFDITRGGPLDGILYVESNDRVRVVWGAPEAMPSQVTGISHSSVMDSNRFSLELGLANASAGGDLGPGEFRITFDSMIEGLVPSPRSGITGHTPGSIAALATAVNRDLHIPNATAASTAMVEEHLSGSDVSILGFDGAGTQRALNDIRTWLGQAIRFTPTPGFPIGSAGYTSVSVGPAPSSYFSRPLPTLPIVGGSTITLTGKFNGFDSATALGSVVVDPANLQIPVQVLGVVDSTGAQTRSLPHTPAILPWRDVEGLVIRTPVVPAQGNYQVQVTFADGFVATDTWAFGNAPVTTTINLAPGSSATYSPQLFPAIVYGTSYSTLTVTSDGRICLGPAACPAGLTPSIGNLILPAPSGAVPTIAALWTPMVPTPGNAITVNISESPNQGANVNAMSISWSNCSWATSGTPIGSFGFAFSTTGLAFGLANVTPETGGTSTAIVGFSNQLGGPTTSPLVQGATVPTGRSFAQAITTSTPINQQLYAATINLLPGFPFAPPGQWIFL